MQTIFFSLGIRTRINKWCENEYVFSPLQFGSEITAAPPIVFLFFIPLYKCSLTESKMVLSFKNCQNALDSLTHEVLLIDYLNME